MSPGNLKQKTISSVKWQVVNKVGQKVLSVLTFAVLARLLDPKDFGLFAMAFIAIDALQFFKSFGLDSALIHKSEDDPNFEKAKNTAFVIIQTSGFAFCAAAVLLAYPMGAFFNKPHLVQIIQVLSAVFILSCLSKVPMTLLTKRMQFNKLAQIEISGSLVNSVVAIAVAAVTRNVWALVIGYVCKQVLMTALSWHWTNFKLKWQYDRDSAKELLSYGRFMMGLSLLWMISANMNKVIVGKILGTTMLGFFALAENVANFVNTHFTVLISGVLFPAYSKIKDDMGAISRGYLKTVRLVSLVTLPFSAVLILLANEFVLVLYGEKWRSIVPLIQLFGIIQILVPITWCSSPVFLACGKPHYTFNMNLASLLIKGTLMVIFTSKWGLVGTVCAAVTNAHIMAPVNIFLTKRLLKIGVFDSIKQLKLAVTCVLPAAAAVLALKWLYAVTGVTGSSFLVYAFRFASMGLAGAAIYLGVFYFADRQVFNEVKGMVWKKKAAQV